MEKKGHTTAELRWPYEKKRTVEEWSSFSLNDMLNTRPRIQYVTDGVYRNGPCWLLRMPRLFLMDGESLSVQASELNYCTPRTNVGPYTHVEVGFLSTPPPSSWDSFVESAEMPMPADVYCYVPLQLVQFYIGAHGGLDRERTFKDFTFRV